MNGPFTHAIVHFDGDSFFASVEQAMNYRLQGKPVVTGGERGAITSLSIEAKQHGLHRGMSMREVRTICPEVAIVASDYTAYSIFARRMYAIVRRFTPKVEEYSIDECFADITGLEDAMHMPAHEIAQLIKRELESHLGVTFGVGLGPSKVIAKIASKHRKPAGFTHITRENIESFLRDMPIGKLWGIGSSTSVFFRRLGVETALQFAQKSEDWIREHKISKPFRAMWRELQGYFINELNAVPEHDDIGSIMKTRTFSPPSQDQSFILSQLSKNIEGACQKARMHGVRAKELSFYLKTQEFTYSYGVVALPIASNDPIEILQAIMPQFEALYVPGILYRATGISLRALEPAVHRMHDLFGAIARHRGKELLFEAIDSINHKYGHETLHVALSDRALRHRENILQKEITRRPARLQLPVHLRKKTIDIPFLGITR